MKYCNGRFFFKLADAVRGLWTRPIHVDHVVHPEVHPPPGHADHAHVLPVLAVFQYVCVCVFFSVCGAGFGSCRFGCKGCLPATCMCDCSLFFFHQAPRLSPRERSSGLTPPRALVSSPPLPVAWKSLSISQCTTRARSQLRVCLCVCV